MHNIYARFSPQCAIYALDFCKIVPISPMRNNCTRFAQDCTYFLKVQYMYKICTRFVQDCTISPMRNICARLYLFPQCAIYAQDFTYFPNAQDCTSFSNAQYMCKICARLYFFLQCAIYAQDFITIYAQNIIIQQVIKLSIFLFKLTGQTTFNKEKKIKSDVIFLIIDNLFEMLT